MQTVTPDKMSRSSCRNTPLLLSLCLLISKLHKTFSNLYFFWLWLHSLRTFTGFPPWILSANQNKIKLHISSISIWRHTDPACNVLVKSIVYALSSMQNQTENSWTAVQHQMQVNCHQLCLYNIYYIHYIYIIYILDFMRTSLPHKKEN